MVMDRRCIPNYDLHESLSKGEGACSENCDGRSHLPLRGKLGWMTPRPGQKKTGKRNASLGLSFPSEGPFPFLVLAKVWQSGPAICSARLQAGTWLNPQCRPEGRRYKNAPCPDRGVQSKNKPRTRLNLRNGWHRFHSPQHWNPRLPEHVLDFGFL